MKEIHEFKELATGFVDPNGRFFPCGYMEHMSTAQDILAELYGVEEILVDPEKALALRGWIAIKRLLSGEHEWLIDWEIPLSPEQIRVIKPAVEENRERILRSSVHMLEYEFER